MEILTPREPPDHPHQVTFPSLPSKQHRSCQAHSPDSLGPGNQPVRLQNSVSPDPHSLSTIYSARDSVMRLKPGQGSLQNCSPSPCHVLPLSPEFSFSAGTRPERLAAQWVATKGQSVPSTLSRGIYLICRLPWALGVLVLRSRPELGSDNKESWGRQRGTHPPAAPAVSA